MRLIDADALIRSICGAKCGCEHEECGSEGDCNFEYFIFSAPTITTESLVRHGQWEGSADGYADGELVYDTWTCNECRHVEDTDDPELLPRYCPNCGAKMED